MSEWSKHVLPHGPITEIATGIWQVTGSLKRNPCPRNMVFWCAPSGEVVIHSAVCLDEDAMAFIDGLGPVAYILVPCKMHRLDARRFKERYPAAQVLCPGFARKAVETAVPVDATFEDVLPGLGVTIHVPLGLVPFELHLEVPVEDGGYVLIMTDALFHLEPQPPAGFGGLVLKWMGSVNPLGITRIGRWLLLKEKAHFRDYLLRLADLRQWSALSVAHGVAITEDVAAALREAASRV